MEIITVLLAEVFELILNFFIARMSTQPLNVKSATVTCEMAGVTANYRSGKNKME
jgi:hypothetical protein